MTSSILFQFVFQGVRMKEIIFQWLIQNFPEGVPTPPTVFLRMYKQRTDFVPKFSVKHFSAYTMSNRMTKILPVTKSEPNHLVHFAHKEMNYDFSPPHLDILNSTSDKTAPEMI